MSGVHNFLTGRIVGRLPVLAISGLVAVSMLSVSPRAEAANAYAGAVNISQVPLFLGAGQKPNVLMLVANSNSMDEDATGLAVGSAAPNSRSEIARRVAKNLVATYQNTLNMGLMAFQQSTGGATPVGLQQLHASPYDVSYNPADWDPLFVGPRTSATKRFRKPNPTDPGNFIYYNVDLPFYSGGNFGNGFCYSPTANAFNNGEVLWAGPWDLYDCYSAKSGPSNAVPAIGDVGAAAAAGYSAFFATFRFFPTDSDLGQGITDFGKMNTWNWVSPTWFSNGSPGKGYIHVPVGLLDAARSAAVNTKLGTSQFVVNGPLNPLLPLQNAGLTPLQGSLETAKRYFGGTLNDPNEGGPLAAPPNSCGKDFLVILTNGLPSVKSDGTPSSDVVTMLADAAIAAKALNDAGVLTYIVGFALPFGVNPAQLDTIAAQGGTGASYYATDEASLQAQLNAVFADIITRSGAASAVAMNSSSISASSRLFQARFDAGWAGQLYSYQIDATTGQVAAVADWDAGILLQGRDPNTRTVITYKPSNGAGVPFRWPSNPAAPSAAEMDLTQVAALNADISATPDGRGDRRVEFLRGDNTREGSDLTTQFRQRTRDLGDIVNSAPVYVSGATRNPADTSYQAFRNSAVVLTRPAMLYVGANDGALHGFDATTGAERLAYVPSPVYSNLSRLTAQSYSHRYYVDGSPTVEDAKIGAGSTWRTMLVSGLGGGGRGLFALDVTDPANFSEAGANDISLWEFTSASDADLGFTLGQPVVAKLNDGSWAVITGNGVNNTGTGQSGIFILNAQTGAIKRKLLTGVGSVATPNGTIGITAVDLDSNGTVDAVYGGDLYGRMWKYDLGSTNPASWGVAFAGNPLFQAERSGDNQPITGAPEVTKHPNGTGTLVMFGTGIYLQLSDITYANTQSIYGIWDNGATIGGLSDLVQQTIVSTFTEVGTEFRRLSDNPVNWASDRGWYIDLPTARERVVTDPIVRNGRLIATSMIPAPGACEAGGYGWLMELNYRTGGKIAAPILDTNNDGQIDNNDQIAGGQRLDAISSAPSILGGFGGNENKYMNQSTGAMERVLETSNPLASRRMSWRQLQ